MKGFPERFLTSPVVLRALRIRACMQACSSPAEQAMDSHSSPQEAGEAGETGASSRSREFPGKEAFTDLWRDWPDWDQWSQWESVTWQQWRDWTDWDRWDQSVPPDSFVDEL